MHHQVVILLLILLLKKVSIHLPKKRKLLLMNKKNIILLSMFMSLLNKNKSRTYLKNKKATYLNKNQKNRNLLKLHKINSILHSKKMNNLLIQLTRKPLNMHHHYTFKTKNNRMICQIQLSLKILLQLSNHQTGKNQITMFSLQNSHQRGSKRLHTKKKNHQNKSRIHFLMNKTKTLSSRKTSRKNLTFLLIVHLSTKKKKLRVHLQEPSLINHQMLAMNITMVHLSEPLISKTNNLESYFNSKLLRNRLK